MEVIRNGKKYCKCEQCEKFATFDNAVKLGWDWFTGHLGRVHHFCTTHSDSKTRNDTFAMSRVKPTDRRTPEGE